MATLADSLSALGQTIQSAASPAMPTPFNRWIGSQRRFDWFAMDLDEVKEIKNRLGGTINDVVLCVVTERSGAFYRPRSRATRSPPRTVSHLLPGKHPLGVRAWSAGKPRVEHPGDGADRAARPGATASRSIAGHGREEGIPPVARNGADRGNLGMDDAPSARRHGPTDGTEPPVQSGGDQCSRARRFPLYLLGARMLEMYPLVPLFSDQGLGIALFSYAGSIFWGFNADRDLVPDLHDFVRDVEESFAELRDAAAIHDTREHDAGTRRAEGRTETTGSRKASVLSH